MDATEYSLKRILLNFILSSLWFYFHILNFDEYQILIQLFIKQISSLLDIEYTTKKCEKTGKIYIYDIKERHYWGLKYIFNKLNSSIERGIFFIR